MTYQELWKISEEELELDSKTIDYMFKYFLNLDENDRIENKLISEDTVNSYMIKVRELKKGIPIQYVVENVNFYGYNFYINRNVLIPRFETEELVYYTKKYILKYFKDYPSLIDIGTGSGVIGITLKKEIPNLNVTLTDVSKNALDVAKDNANKLKIDVKTYESDMLENVMQKKDKFDILISNPPYLSPNEEIMESVKKHEPNIALFGGEDGLKYYEILLRDAKMILKNRALIAFEIGANQGNNIVKIANKYFEGCPYEIKKDLEGRDRMFFLFYNLYD
jgi:release factor glutamine methyltransferase